MKKLKTCLSGHSKRFKTDFNAGQMYAESAILSTFIKQPFVFKIVVLSIFEWPLKTGFTVLLRASNQIYLVLQGVLDDMKVLPSCIKV